MRKLFLKSIAVFVGVACGIGVAGASLFSSTGPVIAIVAGELFLGQAEGSLGGSGTIALQSSLKPELTCKGKFSYSAELGDVGQLLCSDGAAGKFRFERLSLMTGFGSGSSARGDMSFTYGLSPEDSKPYLKLPPGKFLRVVGKDLTLVNQDAAPDSLVIAATLAVTASLRQNRTVEGSTPAKMAELVESTVAPLFDFAHMTQLAMARNWRLASAAQQAALVAQFRALLVRTYSSALVNYSDQVIEYKPLRMQAGDTEATVKSTVKQARADLLSIDYDMEKTPSGWKVYDIKLAGISLITNYQSTFAQSIREGGVEGLIKSLSDKNRQAYRRNNENA